jgi:hypothetical protein
VAKAPTRLKIPTSIKNPPKKKYKIRIFSTHRRFMQRLPKPHRRNKREADCCYFTETHAPNHTVRTPASNASAVPEFAQRSPLRLGTSERQNPQTKPCERHTGDNVECHELRSRHGI